MNVIKPDHVVKVGPNTVKIWAPGPGEKYNLERAQGVGTFEVIYPSILVQTIIASDGGKWTAEYPNAKAFREDLPATYNAVQEKLIGGGIMHKMYFNTGVQLPNQPGGIDMKFHSWRGGTMQIEYHLEHAPPAHWTIAFLCDSLEAVGKHQRTIKVVGGGMMSKYAVFNVRPEVVPDVEKV